MALLLLQRPPRMLTLDGAIDLAIEQSEQIRAAEADLTRAEAERRRARSGLFPQLTGSASYQRTIASEFSSLRRATIIDGVENLDLPFGRKNIWLANLNLSQNLYSGGRIGALQDLARASRNLASTVLETTGGQVELDAAQAFYDAAVADRLVEIAESTILQAEETIRQVEAGFRAGSQPEFEVLRARVDRDNQLPTLNRARADRDIAYIHLRQLLEIPLTEPIELETDLDANPLEVPARYASRFAEMRRILKDPSAPPIERAAVRSAAALVELQEANVRSVRAEAKPSVAAISNYSNVTYPSNVFTGFGGIRTNWTAGASVTWPILTGGRQRADETIARAQADAERARYELAEETAERDARSAWAEVEAAQSTWEATFNTVALARRSYEIAEIRFRSGVSTQLELSVVRLQLRVAESNHALAARDLQVARIRVALLPELPVAEVSFSAGTAAVTRTSRPTPVTPTINGVPAAERSTVLPVNPQLRLPGAQ
jgi:outer membrane protein TolC